MENMEMKNYLIIPLTSLKINKNSIENNLRVFSNIIYEITMKQLISTLALISLVQISYSQQKDITDKNAITQVLNTFMNCLIKKDSAQFYNLFHKDPITWVGLTQKKLT